MEALDAIILAGGKGTRLKSVISDIPKPMAPIGDAPFLQFLVRSLAQHSISRIVFSTGYKGEMIEEFFGSGSDGLQFKYFRELNPLGTGGAVKAAISLASSELVLVLNGDTYFNIDIQSLLEFHKNNGADITIAMRRVENEDRYGVLKLNEDGRIVEFAEKELITQGFINGGIYLMNRELFNQFDLPERFSLENDFFSKYVKELKIYGKAFDDYFIDIGIPEDYEKANKELPEFF